MEKIITVKTITLCKLNFHEKSRKQEKEAGTDFVLIISVNKYYWAVHGNLFELANQDSAISYTQENLTIFNITSKYFSFFNKAESYYRHHYELFQFSFFLLL